MSFVIYTLYPGLSLGTNNPTQMHLAIEDMHINIIIHHYFNHCLSSAG